MARVKVSEEGVNQISNQLSQMGSMQLITMISGALTGFFVVGLLNKLLKKVGYQFGVMYYIFGGILGIVVLGTLQAVFPAYTSIIAYIFMGLAVLSIIYWIYKIFLAKNTTKKTD